MERKLPEASGGQRARERARERERDTQREREREIRSDFQRRGRVRFCQKRKGNHPMEAMYCL